MEAVRRIIIKIYTGIALALTIIMLSFTWPSGAFAACSCPVISRDNIIHYARSGVGSPYVWGGDKWNPDNRRWGGADCSGYVAKAWQVPKTVLYTVSLGHPYSTREFYYNTTHWFNISRGDAVKGDAFVHRSASSGHVLLYERGDPWGNAVIYEARGRSYGIVHRTRFLDSSFKAIRRHHLADEAPQIAASRLLVNKSQVTAQPVGWARQNMYLNNLSSYDDVFITNTYNANERKVLNLQNNVKKVSTSSTIQFLWGKSFYQSVQNNPDSQYLKHALGVVTSKNSTIASAKSPRGYINQALPVSFLNTNLHLNHFRTDQDKLYITNPSTTLISARIWLFDRNRLISYHTRSVKGRQILSLNWLRNRAVLGRAKNVYIKVATNRSVMVSRRLPTASFQQANPASKASTLNTVAHFNPKTDVLFLTNISARARATVWITLYNNGKRLSAYKRVIERRDVEIIDLRKTSAARYSDSSIRIVSRGARLLASNKLSRGHSINAVPSSALSTRLHFERFNAASEMIYLTNPGLSSLTLGVRFYNQGTRVFYKTYTVRGRDVIGLNYKSNSTLRNYHELYVKLSADY